MPVTVSVVQVTPPSILICAVSLLASAAVSEPLTTTGLTLVIKSLELRPVSACRESILIPIAGALRSTVMV